MSEPQIRALLHDFARAWANRDVDALLALMTDDAVYASSVGPEPGSTFRGRDELASGFARMFAHDAGAIIESGGEPLVFGDSAVSQWRYRVPDGGGGYHLEVGVDVWRLRDGRIAMKDAYRKTRG